MWTFFRFGAQASHRNSFPCPGARVLAHRLLWLGHMGLVALRHVGSPQTRDWTHFACVGRWILNHWTTREVPPSLLKAFLESFFSYPENPHDAWPMSDVGRELKEQARKAAVVLRSEKVWCQLHLPQRLGDWSLGSVLWGFPILQLLSRHTVLKITSDSIFCSCLCFMRQV